MPKLLRQLKQIKKELPDISFSKNGESQMITKKIGEEKTAV
jgi:hypothetical protein